MRVFALVCLFRPVGYAESVLIIGKASRLRGLDTFRFRDDAHTTTLKIENE
jgi:hypothetical protein